MSSRERSEGRGCWQWRIKSELRDLQVSNHNIWKPKHKRTGVCVAGAGPGCGAAFCLGAEDLALGPKSNRLLFECSEHGSFRWFRAETWRQQAQLSLELFFKNTFLLYVNICKMCFYLTIVYNMHVHTYMWAHALVFSASNPDTQFPEGLLVPLVMALQCLPQAQILIRAFASTCVTTDRQWG